MIPRYSLPEMTSIWSDENRFKIWLEVETLALEGMVKEGKAPAEALAAVKEKGAFDVERVLEIEAEVKHDVIAFLTNVAEYVGPLSRYVHRGMTSNDLLDTTFAVQLKQSGELILTALDAACDAIKERAIEHQYTPTIGRSHGIHAEPTTFGLKLASWYAELRRQRQRFELALKDVCVGKIAGAVGTYASISPAVEAHTLGTLGLEPETVATQIVHRDRHAAFFSVLAQIGTSIERFSVEIRHLQRTEVREAEESFSKGQKGSSAMPHKRNPILTENLTGLARLLRGYALTALENVPLWHERDISHSSAERVIAPDACIATHFMLHRFGSVVKNLVVHADRMKENLDFSRGLIFSGSLLIALVDNGIVREDAYRLVQKHALAAWEGGDSLEDRVLADPDITNVVDKKVIDEVFDLKRHLRHVDLIFNRAMAS
jgi:adenylosuccinate lyase